MESNYVKRRCKKEQRKKLMEQESEQPVMKLGRKIDYQKKSKL